MLLFLDVPTRKPRIIIIIFPIDRPDIILPTARTTVKGKSFTCFVLIYTWTFLWTFDKASPTLFLVVRTVGKKAFQSVNHGQPKIMFINTLFSKNVFVSIDIIYNQILYLN